MTKPEKARKSVVLAKAGAEIQTIRMTLITYMIRATVKVDTGMRDSSCGGCPETPGTTTEAVMRPSYKMSLSGY